jgi:hypothetical protein
MLIIISCVFCSKVARNESDLPSGLIYSVHSLVLRTVLTRMGIGKDPKPPTHLNYDEMSKRQWRVSFLTPFSGNLAAVFYKYVAKACLPKFSIFHNSYSFLVVPVTLKDLFGIDIWYLLFCVNHF